MQLRERFVRTLTGQDVDRVPFIKVFGGDNAIVPRWEQEQPGVGTHIDRWLRFEGPYRGWQQPGVNMELSSVEPPRVLEDSPERILERRGDGALVMRQKHADYAHQTLEWPVKDRSDWERIKERYLRADDPTRFPADWEQRVERFRQRDYPLQLTHCGVYGFARNLMGDQALAYAFYDDPALVHDIMNSYGDLAMAIWERMLARVDFDLIECWEDMAFTSGALVSPATYREFMAPQYRRLRTFADAHDIRIILVDSDGYIEALTPLMLEAGVTALYPFEVQSGNDVGHMLDLYPGLGAIGGLDKRVMARDEAAIDAEMERARALIRKGRFIPGPDHFVLSDVSYASYRYFMERLREVVMSTQPGA
jgi:uroporphyrinogen decarboxylase